MVCDDDDGVADYVVVVDDDDDDDADNDDDGDPALSFNGGPGRSPPAREVCSFLPALVAGFLLCTSAQWLSAPPCTS